MKKLNRLSRFFTILTIVVILLVNISVIPVMAADDGDPSIITVTLNVTDKSGIGYCFQMVAGSGSKAISKDNAGNYTEVQITRDNYQNYVSFEISPNDGGKIDISSIKINSYDYNTIINEPTSSTGWTFEQVDEKNIVIKSNATIDESGYLQVSDPTIEFTITSGAVSDGSTALATENVSVTSGSFRSGSATVKMTAKKTEGYWTQAKTAIAEFQDTIEFVTNAFLSIAIIVSMIILIVNIIKYASTETHPIKRVTSMKSFLTSLVCIAILGGVWFFTRLIIYLVI